MKYVGGLPPCADSLCLEYYREILLPSTTFPFHDCIFQTKHRYMMLSLAFNFRTNLPTIKRPPRLGQNTCCCLVTLVNSVEHIMVGTRPGVAPPEQLPTPPRCPNPEVSYFFVLIPTCTNRGFGGSIHCASRGIHRNKWKPRIRDRVSTDGVLSQYQVNSCP